MAFRFSSRDVYMDGQRRRNDQLERRVCGDNCRRAVYGDGDSTHGGGESGCDQRDGECDGVGVADRDGPVMKPQNATVPVGAKLPYVAIVVDQNSAAMLIQPSITWTVNGGRTIDANSVFTATTAGGRCGDGHRNDSGGERSGDQRDGIGHGRPADCCATSESHYCNASTSRSGCGRRDATARAEDQNGAPLAAQPAVTWSVSGGGTIDGNGVFTAVTAGGRYNVIATAGNLTGGALVEVTAIQVLTSIKIAPQTLTVPINSEVPFIAIALDQNGFAINPPPAFTWTVSGGGAINMSGVFSATTAGGPFTVSAASSGISGTAQVIVSSANTKPTIKSLAVTPASITIPNGGEQPFMALAKDANGNPINPQPAITWTVSGGGTIDSTGVFTATTVGGPYTVTAAAGSITGTAQVSVADPGSSATGTQTLAFVSGPFAAPNPCFVGCPVQFFAHVEVHAVHVRVEFRRRFDRHERSRRRAQLRDGGNVYRGNHRDGFDERVGLGDVVGGD